MQLQLTLKHAEDNTLLIELMGTMNAVTIAEFKHELKRQIEADSVRIIVDLAAVEFIDSSGLSALISGLKGCREKGGFLRLANIQPDVRQVFELTMLDKVFEMYPSVSAAVEA